MWYSGNGSLLTIGSGRLDGLVPMAESFDIGAHNYYNLIYVYCIDKGFAYQLGTYYKSVPLRETFPGTVKNYSKFEEKLKKMLYVSNEIRKERFLGCHGYSPSLNGSIDYLIDGARKLNLATQLLIWNTIHGGGIVSRDFDCNVYYVGVGTEKEIYLKGEYSDVNNELPEDVAIIDFKELHMGIEPHMLLSHISITRTISGYGTPIIAVDPSKYTMISPYVLRITLEQYNDNFGHPQSNLYTIKYGNFLIFKNQTLGGNFKLSTYVVGQYDNDPNGKVPYDVVRLYNEIMYKADKMRDLPETTLQKKSFRIILPRTSKETFYKGSDGYFHLKYFLTGNGISNQPNISEVSIDYIANGYPVTDQNGTRIKVPESSYEYKYVRKIDLNYEYVLNIIDQAVIDRIFEYKLGLDLKVTARNIMTYEFMGLKGYSRASQTMISSTEIISNTDAYAHILINIPMKISNPMENNIVALLHMFKVVRSFHLLIP